MAGFRTEREGYRSLGELVNDASGVGEVGARIHDLRAMQEMRKLWKEKPWLFEPGEDLKLSAREQDERVEGAWRKLCGKRSRGEPFMLRVRDEASPYTSLDVGVYSPESWVVRNLNIAGVTLGFEVIRSEQGETRIGMNPKIPDEEYHRLLVMMLKWTGEETEEMSLEKTSRRRRARELLVKAPQMRQFLDDPVGFVESLRLAAGMAYGRVMSGDEVAAYVEMLREIRGSEERGGKVVVGMPGGGSHQRFSVREEEGFRSRVNPRGWVLVQTGANEEAGETCDVRLEIWRAPVAVEAEGGQVVGGVIVNTARLWEPGRYREGVFVDHGAEDLFWYRRSRPGVKED